MDVNGREYLARMAELFDLPADALAGLPKVELGGGRRGGRTEPHGAAR